MILQGHNQPTPHGPTPRPSTPSKPSKPDAPKKPGKPAAPKKPSPHKPAPPKKPSKPGKKTAGRGEVDFELEWVEFRPLAKGGWIH